MPDDAVRRGPGRDPARPAGEADAVPHDVRPRALGGSRPGPTWPGSWRSWTRSAGDAEPAHAGRVRRRAGRGRPAGAAGSSALVADRRVEHQRDAQRAEAVDEQGPDHRRVAAVGERPQTMPRTPSNQPARSSWVTTGRAGRAPRRRPRAPRSSRSPAWVSGVPAEVASTVRLPPTSTPSAAGDRRRCPVSAPRGPALEQQRPGRVPGRAGPPRRCWSAPAPSTWTTPSRAANAWCSAVTSEKPTSSLGVARASASQSSRSTTRWAPYPPRTHQTAATSGSSQAVGERVGAGLVGVDQPGVRRGADRAGLAGPQPPGAQLGEAGSDPLGGGRPGRRHGRDESPGRQRARAQQRAAGLPRPQRLALAAAQPGGAEPDDELARASPARARRRPPGRTTRTGRRSGRGRSPAAGTPEAERERVQLVVRRVAGQVRPEPAVTRRVGRVDEDRHAPAGPAAALGPGTGVEADGGRGRQVEALGGAVDGDRDPVVGERGQLGRQAPGLVAEQPGGAARRAARRRRRRRGRPRRRRPRPARSSPAAWSRATASAGSGSIASGRWNRLPTVARTVLAL